MNPSILSGQSGLSGRFGLLSFVQEQQGM